MYGQDDGQADGVAFCMYVHESQFINGATYVHRHIPLLLKDVIKNCWGRMEDLFLSRPANVP